MEKGGIPLNRVHGRGWGYDGTVLTAMDQLDFNGFHPLPASLRS